MLSDRKIIKQFKTHLEKSKRGLSFQHRQARQNHQFYVGDKAAYSVGVNDGNTRAIVNFNRVRPVVNAVAGFMIQMRRKPEYQARLINDQVQQQFSQAANAFSDYLRSDANAAQVESRQDLEMLIAGISATDTSIWYERNPHGEMRIENVSLQDLFWDPEAREKGILDSKNVSRRKKFELDEALKLFKGSKPDEFEAATEIPNEGELIGINQGNVNKIFLDMDDNDASLVTVWSYQYFELKKYFRSANPLLTIQDQFLANQLAQALQGLMALRNDLTTEEDKKDDIFNFDPFGEVIVVNADMKNDLEELYGRFGIEADFVEERKRVYFTAILSGDTVFDKFVSPDQQGFSLKFKTGDYDEIRNRWLGMVDGLKEPAKFANKAFTEMLFVIASNSKGGVIYEESAVDDPKKFEKEYASTQAAVMVNDGAVAGQQIMPKAVGNINNAYADIFTISSQSIPQMAGINPEFLASSENRQVSAILESQRVKQVVSALAGYFDSITLYQKEQARYMLTVMRILGQNSPGRLVRVVGEDGVAAFIEISEDHFSAEYDIDIGEAPESATQKAETAQTLIGLAQQMAPLGINIYPVAIRHLNLKSKDINDLLQAMQPPQQEVDPQQQAQEQAMQQIIFEGQQAQLANTIADTGVKDATAAQRVAAANKTFTDVTNTEADTEKTMAEIDKLDAETRQKQLENSVITSNPVDTLNVVI